MLSDGCCVSNIELGGGVEGGGGCIGCAAASVCLDTGGGCSFDVDGFGCGNVDSDFSNMNGVEGLSDGSKYCRGDPGNDTTSR